MSHIPDDKLFSNGDRVKGKVVVITGGANGIGRETALQFAAHGAKVVIGDLDIAGAEKVVSQIEASGGSGIAVKCNVTSWDNQVVLFESAFKEYGSVDVVVPNAGVSEIGDFENLSFENGKPVKPNLATLDINLTGVIYSIHLGIHYLQQNYTYDPSNPQLKALVLIGSIASWLGIPKGDLYSASKHAVLGLMRGMTFPLELRGIRVGCIHPFFADTGILPTEVKAFLAGIPFTKVSRVAGAIFFAATDRDMATNGSAFMLLDDGPVFMVPKEEFKFGVYKMLDDRVNAVRKVITGYQHAMAISRDLCRIFKRPLIAVVAASVLSLAYHHKSAVETLFQ